MKNISRSVNIVLAGVLVLSILLMGGNADDARAATLATPSADEVPACNPSRSVQVSGTALINVTPDRARVELGVQTNGKSVRAAQSANNLAIQEIKAALKRIGIEAKDISTDMYVINPVYEDYDDLHIKGYRIYNTIAVTVREVDKTSDVVAAALNVGANQVNDVQFYTTELRKYRDEARDLAVKAASEKAEALANSAGTDIGCVLNINENSWSYYNGWYYGSNNSNLWTQNTVQNQTNSNAYSSLEGNEPISLGQISVKAEVSISYALD
ncbi:MAG: SIMPL domain-containing protein [Anaerolineaceae bacterium]|nr:SIMPL domain-containing protein [Anaerolineaceae bacterium]